MTPDPRRLPSARIETVSGAILMPMALGRGHACGVLDAEGRAVPAARTRIGPRRFTADPLAPADTPDVLPGCWLYAGVGRHHFGHFLLEALPRLWALDHAGAPRPDGIALVPMAGRDIAAVLARRLGPLLDILGQGLPVHLVQRPTRVDAALVPSQGFGHREWSHGTPEARAYMRRHLCAAVAPDGPERLYVSRRRLKNPAQQVPHERRIEKWMSRGGYGIVHPERHSIVEQIACYRGARAIVGPDGSAFHLAPFVMDTEARVGLIQRRTRQTSFDAIVRQVAGFAGVTPWTTAALARLRAATEDTSALPPELYQLRRELQAAGFL
jgi:capsular polysaccharide biosynthesis protein